MVAHRVVQFPGDPQPLLLDPSARLKFPAFLRAPGPLLEHGLVGSLSPHRLADGGRHRDPGHHREIGPARLGVQTEHQVPDDQHDSFSLPGTGSTTAQQLLAKAVPAQAGDSDTIVWQVSRGTVRDATVTARMSAMLRQVATMPEVAAVVSPYGPRGAAQISRDGRTAYATVDFAKQANALAKADVTRVIDAAEATRAPGLNVQLGGQAIETTEQAPLSTSSAVGVLAAAVVLFIAFGSLLAMLLPLVTALAGVGGGLLAITPLTHAMNVVDFAPILGALIGLGVGIDYALFIVTRHRRGLQAGLTPADAAVQALNTSGRAVLFAGSTVCIALLGILVLGVGFLNGLAIASALTVIFTVLAAVTLLPALLGVFKMRVLSRRQRRRLPGGWGTGSPPVPGRPRGGRPRES